jgi:TatD DNase family protein
MMLVDSHCHLDFNHFDSDRGQVVANAEREGICRIINPGVDIPSSKVVITLAKKYKSVYAAVGVHPNSSKEWVDDDAAEIGALAQDPNVVAIGEIGLDYYRDWSPPNVQRKAFTRQLRVAAELELPVIIHNRDAGQDIYPLLAEWVAEIRGNGSRLMEHPGVLHSFSGSIEDVQRAYKLNFYFGISGPVTFKNAAQLQEVARELPLERLLIETDAPFLTPHPFRGNRNEPKYVKLVAQKIAELRGITVEQLSSITTDNADRLFNLESV